jgi:hypothetical protein
VAYELTALGMSLLDMSLLGPMDLLVQWGASGIGLCSGDLASGAMLTPDDEKREYKPQSSLRENFGSDHGSEGMDELMAKLIGGHDHR